MLEGFIFLGIFACTREMCRLATCFFVFKPAIFVDKTEWPIHWRALNYVKTSDMRRESEKGGGGE